MSRTFTTSWKRSYWPEPRFGKKESRATVMARVKKNREVGQKVAAAWRVRKALEQD